MRLRHCGGHDNAHRAAACKIRRSVKCSRLCTRRNLPWTAWRFLGRPRYQGICPRERSRQRAAGSGWLCNLDSRQAIFTHPHQPGNCMTARHSRRPARTDGDRHQCEPVPRRIRPALVSGRLDQAALFKLLWPWTLPRGLRSRPSKAATGNHRARARVPSAGP